MRAVIILIVAVCALFCISQVQAQPKIVGGTTASAGQFPWIVRLEINGGVCGGSIIAGGYYVLTAAHCFGGFNGSLSTITATAGVLDYTDTSASTYQIRQASWYLVHPLYNDTTTLYDAALIRVALPFNIGNSVSPIEFATEYPESNADVYIAGWGDTTSGGELSDVLLWTTIPYRPLSFCSETFDGLVSGVQVCAGGEVGFDTCQGDSGGPLISASDPAAPTDARLVGLTSFGIGCGGDTPGVYTDVPQLSSTWVNSILGSPTCRRLCQNEFKLCKSSSVASRNCRLNKRKCFVQCKKIVSA
jgi:trypsin